MGIYDNDTLYRDLSDLINFDINPQTGRGWKEWYMKLFYAVGKDEVLRIASIARADGKDKRRYFSKLLKNAFNKKEGTWRNNYRNSTTT